MKPVMARLAWTTNRWRLSACITPTTAIRRPSLPPEDTAVGHPAHRGLPPATAQVSGHYLGGLSG